MKRIVVIPMYNEARTIIDVLDRAHPHADLTVVIDDGSGDGSGALVSQWAAIHPRTVVLQLAANQGMSAALLVGFSYVLRLAVDGQFSADDVVVTIDADGQHRPEEIPAAVAALAAAGVDLLIGRRALAGYPWFKQVGNWGLSLAASVLGGYRFHDVECGFRVMRLAALADVLPYFTGRRYGCAQEIGVIAARRGWRIANDFPTQITCYRPGARARDGLTNLRMGLTACWRVALGLRRPVAERIEATLARVATTAPVAAAGETEQAAATRWTASS